MGTFRLSLVADIQAVAASCMSSTMTIDKALVAMESAPLCAGQALQRRTICSTE